MASIAVRRWLFFRGRARAADRFDERIKNLAKGLMERLEWDPRLVGPLYVDYGNLAGRIAEALSAQDGPRSV